MDGGPTIPPTPSAPDGARRDRRRRVGRVARGAARAAARRRAAGPRALERVAAAGALARASAIAAALVPARHRATATSSASAFDTLLYVLLALGLNVVVGYAGLLDLGYVAFYGFGAYALRDARVADSSASTGRPLRDRSRSSSSRRALLGFLSRCRRGACSATTSRSSRSSSARLFVTSPTNGNRISSRPRRALDVTGGPNGITERRPLRLFGGTHARLELRGYYYVALVVVPARARRASTSSTNSRTGRAWRSLREDPLAAELMGMPVNRLKLIAFAFGAGDRRAHRHALRRAQHRRLRRRLRRRRSLITSTRCVILGGAGSLGGSDPRRARRQRLARGAARRRTTRRGSSTS